MIRLIDDLMDVSRITSDKIELRKQHVDLRSVIAGVVESIGPTMHASAQPLNVALPAAPIFVSGDVVRLSQVFGNILNNAAKFSGGKGNISIVAEAQGNQAIVRIHDNGPGIPQEMLTEIFESFRQVDATLERSHGGLGIGLMLVKRLTEMHGGTVEARSEGLGKGSEFVVTLPALDADAAQRLESDCRASGDQRVSGARGVGGDHRFDGEHKFDNANVFDGGNRTETNVRSLREVEGLPRHRILVVDDMPELAESFGAVLQSIGQQVRVVHDGPSAIESVLSDRPDIVFLDISMPGMSGYEVARQLRSRPELKGLTLVALTGYGHAEYQLTAAEAGFDHYVTKPIDLEKLRDVLLAVPARDEQAKASGRTTAAVS
jgi:CheY-like chemotaxis protein/two-component sensor histidine kinase